MSGGAGRCGIGRAFAAALALGAGACSSEGPSIFQEIGAVAAGALARPEAAPPAPVTRAELDQIPYATISVSANGGPRAYLVPLADNGGILDYRDAAGNAVRIQGAAVAGFDAVGNDLDAVRYAGDDPIASPRPLALWPAGVWREYQFAPRYAHPYTVALRCVFEPQDRETVEIAEIRYELRRVRETCVNARRTVTNTYWVEDETGFVWKSDQWLGPAVGRAEIEVIRPYAG